MKRLFQISSKFKQNKTTTKVIINAKFDWLRLETKNLYAKQQVLQLFKNITKIFKFHKTVSCFVIFTHTFLKTYCY